ncbi:aldehyde reductase [Kribbella sp. NPDC056861]|uniref:SDR family oxidoreductase n=1 Tax=Kribbella sp. NPDC056861 TaxID=3154857 RepID=UPI00341876A2
MTTQQRVLVTGGSGFIAGHCILKLLDEGYLVRTTMRSLDREAQLRSVLSQAGHEPGDALTVVAADLESDAGWAEAVAGCDHVLHVASPLPHGIPDNEDDVIRPAREGALRVLRAARDAGIKRVVLTSAFGAIGFGYGRTDHRFTEDDWSILDGPGINAYNKSKTFAERAAWDFVATEGGGMELVSINPVAVFGPLLSRSVSGGNDVVRRMLAGELPGFPDFWFPIVDVRDVAAAHVLAMTTPEAAGKRFIIGSGEGLTMKQIGLLLRDRLGAKANKVPTRSIPTFVLRVAARFNPGIAEIAPMLGITKNISTDLATGVLGLKTRSPKEAVLATAESMFDRGVV